MDLRNTLRTTSIALSLFGLTTLSSACMMHSSSKVKDDQLGRLSAADREQLIDRERDVNVAKANVDTSKVALDEAKQFRDGSHDEAKAAKQQQEDVADNLKRAEKSGGTADIQTLTQREEARAAQAKSLNAKAMYSDRLVDLRKAQVENREAEHKLMEARLSRAQYDLLKENDLAGDLDGNKFVAREGEADRNYQRTQQQVQERMAAARASKDAWTEQRQLARFGMPTPAAQAGQEVESPELIEAPQPVDALKMGGPGGGSAQAKSAGAKDDGAQQKSQTQKTAKQQQKSRASQGAKTTPPGQTAPQQPTTPTTPQTAPAPAAPQTTTPPAAPQQQPATPQPAPSTTPQQTAPTQQPTQPTPAPVQP